MASSIGTKFRATFYPRPELSGFSEEDIEDSDGLEDVAKSIHSGWVEGLSEEFSKAGGVFFAELVSFSRFHNTIELKTEGEFYTISVFSGTSRAFRKLAKRDGEKILKNLKHEYARHRVKFDFEILEVRITTS